MWREKLDLRIEETRTCGQFESEMMSNNSAEVRFIKRVWIVFVVGMMESRFTKQSSKNKLKSCPTVSITIDKGHLLAHSEPPFTEHLHWHGFLYQHRLDRSSEALSRWRFSTVSRVGKKKMPWLGRDGTNNISIMTFKDGMIENIDNGTDLATVQHWMRG